MPSVAAEPASAGDTAAVALVAQLEDLCRDARLVLETATVDAERRAAEAAELLQRARDEAERVRARARAEATALADPAPRGTAVNVLRALLGDATDPLMRTAALAALSRASEAAQLDALHIALDDPDAGVRLQALTVLPVCRGPQASSALIANVDDGDAQVRSQVTQLLVRRADWVVWAALRHSCAPGELAGLVAAEPHGSRRLRSMARERLASPEPEDRVLALQLCARDGEPECPPEVLLALGDVDHRVRAAAAAALAARGATASALGDALGDDRPADLRRLAADALSEVPSPAHQTHWRALAQLGLASERDASRPRK